MSPNKPTFRLRNKRRPIIRRSLADRFVAPLAEGLPRLSQACLSRRRLVRRTAIGVLDWLAIALPLSWLLVSAGAQSSADAGSLAMIVGLFSTTATALLFLMGLYHRSWRFVNFSDCLFLAASAALGFAVAWLGSLSIPAIRAAGSDLLPIALMHWIMATFLMCTARMTRRGIVERTYRNNRRKLLNQNLGKLEQVLLIGPPHWARSVIDVLHSDASSLSNVEGVLLLSNRDAMDRLSGVPVLGTHEVLREAVETLEAKGLRPKRVIAFDDENQISRRDLARIIHVSRDLGLEISRVCDSFAGLLQRSPKEIADDLPMKELLGRREFNMDENRATRQLAGRCILVTGAGGTIGGELCRQIAAYNPSRLVLLDHSEIALYTAEMLLREQFPKLDVRAELCSVRQRNDVRRVFAAHRPVIVYHAAALKHVPIVEANPCAGVHTNVIGTRIIADAVCEYEARAMVQVSTDKAVNPVGMMGATKRVGELYSQALDLCGVDDSEAPRFMTVRFGNVLGSSGSIVPLFMRQLREGKPLTVTHPDIERFFMTVREAVHLIVQSSSSALEQETERGTIFVLDMGKPVRIVDLAHRMILLYGLEPDVDVPIRFVGLRPGEKLYEELFDTCEERLASGIPGIFEARSRPIPLPMISRAIDRLDAAVRSGDHAEACRITHGLVNLPTTGGTIDFLPSHAPPRSDAGAIHLSA